MSKRLSKRLRWLAVVPVILLAGLIQSSAGQAYCKSEFRKYFEGLGAAAAVNPVERVIFSIVLANAEQTAAARPESPNHL
ncbi:MAG: hypothetical protein HYX25_08415 [Candidatus Solibacter usitatus]|nr:hypothetical protein [Candidatus Solibacter usitatus]